MPLITVWSDFADAYPIETAAILEKSEKAVFYKAAVGEGYSNNGDLDIVAIFKLEKDYLYIWSDQASDLDGACYIEEVAVKTLEQVEYELELVQKRVQCSKLAKK
jgi:hypothetical protein